jgi:hypothetical protein
MQTRFGCAGGRELVHYVLNIRNYYDILKWFTNHEARREGLQADAYSEELHLAW